MVRRARGACATSATPARYLLRDGELYQITHDHTLVQSLVDEGRISADDVATHPQRSLLLRALDGRSIAEPDLSVHEARPGDRYLLCSDGLSGVVSDETLRETLATIEDPRGRRPPADRARDPRRRPGQHHLHRRRRGGHAPPRLPLTTAPVLAGAAASMADLRLADGTGPLRGLDDHQRITGGPRPSRSAAMTWTR